MEDKDNFALYYVVSIWLTLHFFFFFCKCSYIYGFLIGKTSYKKWTCMMFSSIFSSHQYSLYNGNVSFMLLCSCSWQWHALTILPTYLWMKLSLFFS
jgi:hypothetical protein